MLHIVNPAAGKGVLSREALRRLEAEGADVRVTSGAGDAERIVRAELAADPALHIVVYGGDGTLCEAVNGVMAAGAGDTAVLSVVPTGSGNDFARVLTPDFDLRVDLLKLTLNYDADADERRVRYAVNMVNIGFDCEVVRTMESYRRKWYVRGSGAYYLALADTLLRKPAVDAALTVEDERGETSARGRFLLFAVANGQYCGGGFRSNPLSELDDGVLDVIIANDIGRLKFVNLVGDYKKGTHIDAAARALKPKFDGTLTYRRCRSLSVTGRRAVCADGEITETDGVRIETERKAVRITAYRNAPADI